jgi:PPOX class probable F420-dependent enzyme
MRTGLAVSDLGDFLEEPRVAILATLRADGSVQLSPVWHEWRDGGFNVWIGIDDVKGRHLRRDPRATIVVAGSEPPLRGIEVRGTVSLIEQDVLEAGTRIASRYVGRIEGERFARSLDGESLVARLVPGELRVWDFADEY